MNISESIGALQRIAADFSKMPGRINSVLSSTSVDKESEAPPPKEGLENVMTDMLIGENAFTANVKVLKHMNAVEDILLNELRDK